MVCQAASQTRFRALKHENGIEGEPTIIVRVIACFQPLHDCQRSSSKSLKIPFQDAITSTGHIFHWMVKAHRSWPYPQHVAWPSPYLNSPCTLAEPSSLVHSTYMNSSTCVFPAISIFPGFTAPAIPNLKTEQTNEVQGFLQHPSLEPCLIETHTGEAMQNASLQKKLIVFDHSGSKTRLLYSPVFPFVQSPITDTQFTQVYDVNEEAQATNMGLKHWPIYTSPEEIGKDHMDNEESEMHEDTEEINALLYSDDSDDGDDEVTSTGHSPLVTEKTCVIQEQFVDMKEEVASSDWPNKRQKLIDGEFNRLPPLVESASSERLNKMCEYASDAESNYSSSGEVYATRQTKEDKSTAADIQLKKDKIRKLLRVLENFIPGAKGKHPLLVIDGTIEYLESLMSQTGTLKYH